jgi:hypothetical protein
MARLDICDLCCLCCYTVSHGWVLNPVGTNNKLFQCAGRFLSEGLSESILNQYSCEANKYATAYRFGHGSIAASLQLFYDVCSHTRTQITKMAAVFSHCEPCQADKKRICGRLQTHQCNEVAYLVAAGDPSLERPMGNSRRKPDRVKKIVVL